MVAVPYRLRRGTRLLYSSPLDKWLGVVCIAPGFAQALAFVRAGKDISRRGRYLARHDIVLPGRRLCRVLNKKQPGRRSGTEYQLPLLMSPTRAVRPQAFQMLHNSRRILNQPGRAERGD